MNGKKVNFKIHTGTNMSVIPNHIFNQFYNSDTSKIKEIKKTTKIILMVRLIIFIVYF